MDGLRQSQSDNSLCIRPLAGGEGTDSPSLDKIYTRTQEQESAQFYHSSPLRSSRASRSHERETGRVREGPGGREGRIVKRRQNERRAVVAAAEEEEEKEEEARDVT